MILSVLIIVTGISFAGLIILLLERLVSSPAACNGKKAINLCFFLAAG